MLKNIIYTYLGTNGTLSTPIYLEGIYSIKNYTIVAEKGKKLTKNGKELFTSITVPENEIEQWYEIDD